MPRTGLTMFLLGEQEAQPGAGAMFLRGEQEAQPGAGAEMSLPGIG
jgi:hypothetical protein